MTSFGEARQQGAAAFAAAGHGGAPSVAGPTDDPRATPSADALWAGLVLSSLVTWLMYRTLAVKGAPRRG
jgi:hypothetical protein